MLVISSREFRQNQREYFERADRGEQVIVQRGKDRSYVLTPIHKEDLYFSAEMIDKLKQSIEEVDAGKTLKINSAEGIKELLGL